MFLQKLIIISLTFLLFPSFVFKPDFREKNNFAKQQNDVSNLNIDSVRAELSKTGWNRKLLEKYANYIINFSENPSEELNIIKKLPNSFEKNYLKSLILKRKGNYAEMYAILWQALKSNPNFIPYYNELVFSSMAADKIGELKSKIESDKSILFQNKKYTLALINSYEGHYDESLKLLKDAAVRDSTNKYMLYQLSYAYRNIGDYNEAVKIINRVIKNSSNNKSFISMCCLAAGSLYYLSNNQSEAEKYYKKGFDLSIETHSKINEAVALVDLGIIEDEKGNVSQARENYNKAISISDAYNDVESNALAHSELGVSYSYTNELLKAKTSYKKSYDLYSKIGNKLRLSFLCDNIAKLYMSQFNYKSAKDLYAKGLQYAGDNKRAQVINLIGMADIYTNLSNYTKALEYYKKAAEISSEIKDVNLEIEINSGLGTLDYNIDNNKGALKYYKKESEFSSKSGDVYSLADSYRMLGEVYLKLDNADSALYYLNNAIELSSKYSAPYIQSVSLIDLTSLRMMKNELEKAKKSLGEADKISSKYDFTYLKATGALLGAKILEMQSNFKAAHNAYNNVLKITKNINEPNLSIILYYSLAMLSEKNNDVESAENYFQSAVNIIDRISYALYGQDKIQIAYFGGKQEVFDNYAKLLLNEKKYKQAFELIDHSRSRNTIQNLAALKLESSINDTSMLNKIYDYEWIINSGLYDSTTIDSVKTDYNNLKQFIVKNHPELQQSFSFRKVKSLSSIQNLLGNDENLISFYSTGDKLFSFLINKNEFKTFEINLTKRDLFDLTTKLSPYFKSDTNSNRPFYNQDLFSFNVNSSFKFYKKVIEPVLNEVPKNQKVIFSLSPELAAIPFEFLVTKYNDSTSAYNYAGRNYLIDDYQISYTPSVELYIKSKDNDLSNINKVLIVGDPYISNKSLGFSERRGLIEESGGLPRNFTLLPLEYSKQEVDEIGSLVSPVKMLTEQNATETNFKKDAQYSRIIHLSTHSFMLNHQPVIFFSNYDDKDNDGLLEASEIVQLKLNSDLVVLSSCNSGLGLIDESEGIIGMTKAFYEAGAKSVIVSLWPVNDKYTSKLMGLFYENLTKGMNKSEALRQAKIDFIKLYSPNPYYWSAFVLSGNTGKIKLERPPKILPFEVVIILVVVILLGLILRNRIPRIRWRKI